MSQSAALVRRVLLIVSALGITGSFGYNPFLLGLSLCIFIFAVLSGSESFRAIILQRVFGGFFRAHVLLIVLFTASLIGLAVFLLTPQRALPNGTLALPMLLLWAWLTAYYLLLVTKNNKAQRTLSLLFNLNLSLALLVVSAEVILQLMFNTLPPAIRYRMPQYPTRAGIVFNEAIGAREFPAHQQVAYHVDGRTGDLYELTCLTHPEAPLFPPYDVSFVRDSHGFRNREPTPLQAELVVVGDSFTAAEMVQTPFWANITPNVYTMGLPDSGTLEQNVLLETYGFVRSPRIVVQAYFGGNDMQNNWDYQHVRAAGETFYKRDIVNASPLELLVLPRLGAWLFRPSISSCPYPITDSQGNRIAFYDPFFANAMLPPSALQQTDQFQLTRQAILAAAEQTRRSGAVFILLYIPYSAETHWNLLSPEQIAEIQYRLPPENFGYSPRIAEPLSDSSMDAQRHLLSELAHDHEFLFLDLTPAFRAATEAGTSLYFYGDTHFNQAGHDLARATLTEFLMSRQLLPVS